MRCTIGFYGLNRSPSHTAPSILANIYAPLEQAGIGLTRIGHFNAPTVIHSPRSGEHNLTAADPDLDQLRLDDVRREPQTEDSIRDEMAILERTTFRNEADPGGHTRRNLLWQLHSLRGLYDMIMASEAARTADFFLILRPDLRYLDKLRVRDITTALAQGVDLLTPNWATHAGMNDRIAVCAPSALEAYCTRIRVIEAMVAKYGHIHSETLLLHAVQSAGLRTGTLRMRGQRVRASGVVVNERFLYRRVREKLVFAVRSVMQQAKARR